MIKGLAILGLLAWAGVCAANSTQANYFELHYGQTEFGMDGPDRDSDLGFGFRFAKSFWDYAAWYADFDWRHDQKSPELDFVTASVGAGPRLVFEDAGGLALQVAVSFEHMRVRLQDDDPATPMTEVTSIQNNGVGGSLGLSLPIGDQSELFGRYTYIDITDADDETFEDERVFVGGFRWGLTDAFSIVLSAQDYETFDTTEFRVGAAVNF